jgi:uncharacterized protein (UPF0332 family)
LPQAIPIDPLKLTEAGRAFANQSGSKGRPRPIWLRRSVSSAYYALFHRLCRDAAAHLLPKGTPQEQLQLARAFGHRDMKAVCAQIAGREGGTHQHVRPLVDRLKQTGIADVARSFCDLQEARHRADYDHLSAFSKAVALAHVDDAEKAMQILDRARKRDRDTLFSLLAIGARLR